MSSPENTTYQEAYDAGYKAFKQGAVIQDNPYDSSSPIVILFEAWLAGFIDAREEHY